MGTVDVAGHRHAPTCELEDGDVEAARSSDATWRRALAVALTLAAIAPVLVVVVVRAGEPYLPVQDLAVVDLRVRDVWSSNIPLVGPYSKGFSHPGPLVFWLLAVPSALLGGAAWATLVGGAVLQGVAIAATARLAWRRGGLSLLVVVLGALLLTYPGATNLLHPWNPNIAFPFFPLYLLLVWAVADGDRSRAVWATVVGVFLVQTHIGYAALVAIPAVWAAVVVWSDSGRSLAGLRPWRRAALQSAVVGAVLCAPIVLDQFVGTRNLGRITSYFRGTGDDSVGLRTAAGLLATEFRLPPPWLGGRETFETFSAEVEPSSPLWLLLPAAVVVAGLLVARRSSSRSDQRLIHLVIVTGGTALVAMSQLRPPIEPYLFRWRAPVAALLVLTVVWVVLRAVARVRAPWVWRVAGVIGVALLVGRGVSLADQVTTYRVGAVLPFEPVARQLLDPLEDQVPTEPVLVRGNGLGGLPEAVVNELDRRGASMRLDEGWEYKWGRQRVAEPASVSSIWYVVQQGVMVSTLTDIRGARVLARTTPLDRSAERGAVDLQRRLVRQLRDAGREDLVGRLDSGLVEFALQDVAGIDDAAVRRLAVLNAEVERDRLCRCAVVAVPPDAPGLDELPPIG